jgi:hypothetical protein
VSKRWRHRLHYKLASFSINDLPSTAFDFSGPDRDAAKAGARVATPLAGVLAKVFTAVGHWTAAEPGREWSLVAGSITSYVTGHVDSPLQKRALSCAKEGSEAYAEAAETGAKWFQAGWAAVNCIGAWFAD